MKRREFMQSMTALAAGGALSSQLGSSTAEAAASTKTAAAPSSERVTEGHMQKFILDLRWTPKGLENVPNGTFHDVRKEAIAFAGSYGLTFFPPNIVDRLVPTPVGPIWFVEGRREDVEYVVARFNGFGCVTAQYFDYNADAAVEGRS
jgi:hypothetical protein